MSNTRNDIKGGVSEHDIAVNLAAINARIALAQDAYSKVCPSSGEVELVAVSKRQPAPKVDAALAAGHRVFGENRVQEAKNRWLSRRPKYENLKLHLIGPLQTNKVSDAVALFDVIEVVDRPKLAQALASEMKRQKRYLPCFIQVNTGEEVQKSGIFPDKVDDFIAICRHGIGLDVAGVMCIPPVYEEASMHFALLQVIARRNGLSQLSMGMSDDFEEAIAFGATTVRVGSAIFGERDV